MVGVIVGIFIMRDRKLMKTFDEVKLNTAIMYGPARRVVINK